MTVKQAAGGLLRHYSTGCIAVPIPGGSRGSRRTATRVVAGTECPLLSAVACGASATRN
jgi:hypothetical protein